FVVVEQRPGVVASQRYPSRQRLASCGNVTREVADPVSITHLPVTVDGVWVRRTVLRDNDLGRRIGLVELKQHVPQPIWGYVPAHLGLFRPGHGTDLPVER